MGRGGLREICEYFDGFKLSRRRSVSVVVAIVAVSK